MTDTDRDAVETLIGLIEHNKAWVGLEDIDVEAYEESVLTLRALLAAKEEAEAERDRLAEALQIYDGANMTSAAQFTAMKAERDNEGSWKAACQYRQRLARNALDQPKEGDEDA